MHLGHVRLTEAKSAEWRGGCDAIIAVCSTSSSSRSTCSRRCRVPRSSLAGSSFISGRCDSEDIIVVNKVDVWRETQKSKL